LLPTCAHATTYYLDCAAGSDSNNGTSPTTAWRSIGRANQVVYQAGDAILLKRACAWNEPGFKASGNGTVSAPITLGDYGSGTLPQIVGVGEHEPAVLLQNVQNWIVRNLDLTQDGQAPQGINDSGKDVDANSDEYMRAVVHILALGPPGVRNCGEPCTVRNIRLENLKVHDGSWNGIYSGAGYYQLGTDTYGYVDNVVIANVESWNHHKSGIDFTSTYHKTRIYPTTNVQVIGSSLHDNGADGVVMGPVRHGLIDGNECAFNGRLRDARLGCWTWDSEDTTIQFNESHHNMTPENGSGARDGGGFDCDLGSEDCLIAYNWSHDNAGEGFLLMQWPIGYGFQRGDSHNIHMRYNIGERDAKKLAGAIEIFGGPNPVFIHNNTIYYEPNRLSGSVMFEKEGGVLTSSTWARSGTPTVFVYNNIFIANGTVNPAAVSNLVRNDAAKGTFSFDNNLWWRVEGGVRFQWGNSIMTTFTAWRNRGFDPNGMNLEPMVIGPLGGGPAAYALLPSSPAIDKGTVVTGTLRGMGTRDYIGTPIPQGVAHDIGAVERPSSPSGEICSTEFSDITRMPASHRSFRDRTWLDTAARRSHLGCSNRSESQTHAQTRLD
jgi:hypothetical protein